MDDAIIDFSNPEAVAWYGAQIEGLIRMGASSIKTDFGEGFPRRPFIKTSRDGAFIISTAWFTIP